MSKAIELDRIRLNISSLEWQLRNFSPLSPTSQGYIDEALQLMESARVEVMLATAKEEMV